MYVIIVYLYAFEIADIIDRNLIGGKDEEAFKTKMKRINDQTKRTNKSQFEKKCEISFAF